METAAMFHEGQKISGKCGSDIRFHIGMVEAHAFYISQLGWYAATFDNVDWKLRDKCFAPKPDMFKMWVLLNVDNWMAQFISKLLHLTHGQWIYHNISKYHNKLGLFCKTERWELLLEIDCLIHVSPSFCSKLISSGSGLVGDVSNKGRRPD
jgi:hypothetical protein